jgi:hypothetical protein
MQQIKVFFHFQRTKKSNREVSSCISRETEARMAKTFALIIGALMLCWAPQLTIYFVVGHTKDDKYFQKTTLLRLFHVIAILTAQVNSAINPFIYAYRIKAVRDAIKETIGIKQQSTRDDSDDQITDETMNMNNNKMNQLKIAS